MKLKKIKKILPPWEIIRVWGNDEIHPLYYGEVEGLPKELYNLEMAKDEDTLSYLEVRYGSNDIEDHVCVFVNYGEE